MDSFNELLAITDRLHSPEGCPWDREQTFESLKPYILEEAHEAIEAIDEGEDAKIIEELGDLFYTVIFYAKLADKKGRFSIEDVLSHLCAKLIRRHPHVFGEEKARSVEEVMRHWERVKKEEGTSRGVESVLDSIPKTLPSLARAQKAIKRMQKSHYPISLEKTPPDSLQQAVLNIVCESTRTNIDLEDAFRTLLKKEEEKFRAWEKEKA